VHEHILAAIVTNDEAKAFLGVEEFDDAFGLADDLRGHTATAAARAAEAATATAAAETAAATATAEAIAATAVTAATTTAEAVTAASAVAPFTAAEIVTADIVALVSAATAALAAAPSVKTHVNQILSAPNPLSEPPRRARREQADAPQRRRAADSHR